MLIPVLGACESGGMAPKNESSRDQELPLFNPHMATFDCQLEAERLPPIDAQADVWFREALALDSADIFPDRRDYKKIVWLTRQAADRKHWKAMLNLASLYIEGHDPSHGVEDAVRLVEEGMRLGVPAAHDRMGTYYSNGTGVKGDATRAYAFWQRASEMGSPAAMAYLGKKLKATWDDPQGSFWANRPIGLKMLECAYAQGNADAAFQLALSYRNPAPRAPTREDRARALLVMHEGVKFGSEDCANSLQMEFGHPFDPEKMLAPYIDKARAERYRLLGDALGFDPSDRFPNLDKILPLPPAELPPWNGDRDTLLNAARGVSPPPASPKPGAASQRSGRFHLDAAFALRDTGQETRALSAPVEGFWQPTGLNVREEHRVRLAAVPPGLYRSGEEFPIFTSQDGKRRITGIVWRRWDTIRHNHGAVEPFAPAGMVRIVPRPQPLLSRPSGEACPVSGTWQPWVRPEHPLSSAFNVYWRQAWMVKGQAFPDPQRDWQLPIPAAEVSWHLMDSEPVSLL
ncbi:tetratricopeptide repeat protein [Pseudoduganella sp.]|uniref:tetratricopeptide repeat protein n=1 Tax=Pseudoduganella sp. TaxID=1880898 RepID=UPI0035B0E884